MCYERKIEPGGIITDVITWRIISAFLFKAPQRSSQRLFQNDSGIPGGSAARSALKNMGSCRRALRPIVEASVLLLASRSARRKFQSLALRTCALQLCDWHGVLRSPSYLAITIRIMSTHHPMQQAFSFAASKSPRQPQFAFEIARSQHQP